MSKIYECENPACSLGVVGAPGRFSGGISKEQVNLLTGAPVDALQSGKDFGPGICPNCGKEGKEI